MWLQKISLSLDHFNVQIIKKAEIHFTLGGYYAEDVHRIYTFQHVFSASVFCIVFSAWFTLAVEKSALIYFEFLLCLQK